MKKYEIIKANNESQAIKFYKKIVFSILIFCVVVTLCKLNPGTDSYVKKVLNNSCDFHTVQVKISEIVNNIKKQINIDEIFVWEE